MIASRIIVMVSITLTISITTTALVIIIQRLEPFKPDSQDVEIPMVLK